MKDFEAERHQASVLYQALVGVGARHNMKKTALLMGISYATLDDYCTGRANFPLYRLPSLWAATHDLELMSELTRLGDVGVVFCEAARGEPSLDTRRSSALQVSGAAGRVAQLVDEAEADNVVTGAERDSIAKQLDDLERKAEGLRAKLPRRKELE